ncbi:MAG: hypothetical protein KF886_09350 [Candidatus Hydrogenedentes bacterium]|nr:hypothetical protein [Candidatus Hydrogenedentota bacterium]
MFETLVLIGFVAIAAWLLAGLLLAAPLYRSLSKRVEPGRLPRLDRLFLAPGIAVFWPVLLWRSKNKTGRLPQPNLGRAEHVARWQPPIAVITFLATPPILALALLGRDVSPLSQPIPFAVIPDNELLSYGANLGNAFPSLPAEVFPARTTAREYGLELRFRDGEQALPSIIYWAPTQTSGDILPDGSVYIGLLWPWPNLWRRFPEQQMSREGFWYVYHMLDRSLERLEATSGSSRGRR